MASHGFCSSNNLFLAYFPVAPSSSGILALEEFKEKGTPVKESTHRQCRSDLGPLLAEVAALGEQEVRKRYVIPYSWDMDPIFPSAYVG